MPSTIVNCPTLQEQTHQILSIMNHTCLSEINGACQARGNLRGKLAAVKALNCLPPPGNFNPLAKDYLNKRKKRTLKRLKTNPTGHPPILTDEWSLNIKYWAKNLLI